MSRQRTERRQYLSVKMRANGALQPRPVIMLDDLRTGAFQQASIRHARRTSGLAVHAAETTVNMGDERVAQRQPALVHLHHLVDAATRGIHLRTQRAIGWTLVQTKPAVDALGVQVPRGLLSGLEVRGWLFRNWSYSAQNRNLPRFKTSRGSSVIFTFRMLSRSVGIGPHAVTWWRAFGGQWRTAILASRGKRLRRPDAALTKLTIVTSASGAGHMAINRWPTPTLPTAARVKSFE